MKYLWLCLDYLWPLLFYYHNCTNKPIWVLHWSTFHSVTQRYTYGSVMWQKITDEQISEETLRKEGLIPSMSALCNNNPVVQSSSEFCHKRPWLGESSVSRYSLQCHLLQTEHPICIIYIMHNSIQVSRYKIMKQTSTYWSSRSGNPDKVLW